MKDFLLGLQLFTVRSELEKDFVGTLKKVKEMGYDGIEFGGTTCGYSAAEVKKICEEIGLIPFSAHIRLLDMLENPEILKVYKEIGCEYTVIPYLEEGYRPGEDGFDTVVEGAKSLTKKANELGLKMCYHNHDFEFDKVGDEYAIDLIYREAPELQPEFDTCWVKVTGVEPVDYIKKYAGRQEILHLKDFVGGRAENMYALIGIDEDEEKDTGGKFEFRPVGYGCQDFPSILVAAKEVGIKWVIVEQDQPSLDKTPLECAKMSIDYLNNL